MIYNLKSSAYVGQVGSVSLAQGGTVRLGRKAEDQTGEVDLPLAAPPPPPPGSCSCSP